MKKIFFFFLCLLTLSATAKVKPQKLRVLYLGGQIEWYHGESGQYDHFDSEAAYQQAVAERSAAFEQLLKTYFTTVKAMPAKDWRPEMSEQYDVTIFDGMTQPVDSVKETVHFLGRTRVDTHYIYIPEDFSRPCITIGTMGETLCRPIGIKNDWLCHCLDAKAHTMILDHPIFKGPFKTTLTLRKEPTPVDAMHYTYFQNGHTPETVMMWRVNTKGYMTEKGYQPGMVSRPWGYTDSPDCEFISGGVSAKTIDAVALGRHANYFHWGFIGSPLYMTDEAKIVFANAVAYIAKHPGKPLVRKFNDHVATREYIKEVKHLCLRRTVEEENAANENFYKNLLEKSEAAKKKKERGEKLTDNEVRDMRFTPDMVPAPKTYAEALQENAPGLYEQFGEDEQKYLDYYNENTPYFYGGTGTYNLIVDGDVKAWGIANNDKRLIEKAITCLEKDVETDRAHRVLERYTMCDFQTPQQWREWYDRYNKKMFFTESGGWVFMVNDPQAPGNDYSILKKRKSDQQESNADPQKLSHDNPFIVSVRSEDPYMRGVDVIIDIQILKGYHIYRTVDDSDPYIPLKITFELPDGAQLGETIYPMPKPFTKTGTTIYDSNVTISQNIRLTELPATVKCTVELQCCDAHVCLPPYEETFTVTIK